MEVKAGMRVKMGVRGRMERGMKTGTERAKGAREDGRVSKLYIIL